MREEGYPLFASAGLYLMTVGTALPRRDVIAVWQFLNGAHILLIAPQQENDK